LLSWHTAPIPTIDNLTAMPAAAPRLHPRVLARLERLERSDLHYAEIRRGLVVLARELGVPPPSYEHVRRLAKQRRLARVPEGEVLRVVVGVALGTRHGNELLHAVRTGESRRETA